LGRVWTGLTGLGFGHDLIARWIERNQRAGPRLIPEMLRRWIVMGVFVPGMFAAEVLELRPVADTTLFQQAPGNNMGGHSHVAIGSTGLGSDARGLFRFDVRAVPPNAVIESVSLTFTLPTIPRGDGSGSEYAVHRMLTDWGEGTKVGNTGTAAGAGEASWNHSASPTTWAAPGAAAGTDFVTEASATEVLGPAPGVYTVNSTAALVADVTAWIENGGNNFGWLVKAVNENATLTARRFAAREAGDGAGAVLRVEYTVMAEEDLQITSVERVENNVMIRWTGGVGDVVVERASGWRATWEDAGTSGSGEFSEAIAAGVRFYRLRD